MAKRQTDASRVPPAFNVKDFKYGCAFLALGYLVLALLPTQFMENQITGAEIVSEWVGRPINFAYSLLFAAAFYGLQRRLPIFWKLIPVLLGLYLLTSLTGAIWFLHGRTPWAPLIFVIVGGLTVYFVFIVWWRNQKSYFA